MVLWDTLCDQLLNSFNKLTVSGFLALALLNAAAQGALMLPGSYCRKVMQYVSNGTKKYLVCFRFIGGFDFIVYFKSCLCA